MPGCTTVDKKVRSLPRPGILGNGTHASIPQRTECRLRRTTMPPPTGVPAEPPPDGGWGWAVVLGSFISIGFSYAFPKAITVFFKDIQIIFGASYSQIAWISSIMLAVMYAAGPISSILVNTYGCRPVVMMGGCLCAVGMISASFCNSVPQLYLCIGVIGGLGLAFNLQPALTMIGKYFFKKRPIANGLAMAGSPVFLSTLAPLNQFLFNRFGWRGSFLILAYAKDMGVDEYSAAFLLSILAFVDMFARPSMGLVANSRWIRPRIQYFFSFAVLYNGVCHLLCPLADDYTGLVIYAIFFGFAFGMVSSVLFETLMDLVGAPRFSSAVGLTTIVECCPVLIGPPLAGKLVDVTKNYKYMYFCCGSVVIVASIWLFIGNFINYRLLDRERKQAEMYKRTETEDPDKAEDQKGADAEAQQLSQEPDEKKVEEPMQRETNM
uniref:Monocarboxylate transporter 2 n=1 Tax=Knipowitschia caucasica TaxID=637954 RepID=A0AAV2ITS7_KNICA